MAGSANKSENARRDIALSIHLLDIISEDKDHSSDNSHIIRSFTREQWDKIYNKLISKKGFYQNKQIEARDAKIRYPDRVPELLKLDIRKFLLDRYGQSENDSVGADPLIKIEKLDDGKEIDTASLSPKTSDE